MKYETVIGLEVHAQLLTKSKMFCRCSASYANAEPNTHVCPVCLGMPGVLPTINKQAVEFVMMTALALNGSVSRETKFDRKNYPYPDLMKGYQISQFDAPIGVGGWMDIVADGESKKIGITRVHLEEDVSKLIHHSSPDEEHYSLVDVNRSSVPLMEIVSEPDMRSAEEARQYLMKLHSILQYLGVSTANMEEGSFRCDANISIRPENTDELLAKVEVKNMNSYRAVYRALEYEAKRQRKALAEGKTITQETRGWVENRGVTFSQRSKEYAHDYRYFPEPDLPPMVISDEWVAEVKSKLPELPEAKRDRFMVEYGLPLYDANLLTSSQAMGDYFEECLKVESYGKLTPETSSKEVSNWILGEVSRLLNSNSCDIVKFEERVEPRRLCELILCCQQKTINVPTAKSVLEQMFNSKKDAAAIIKERGLSQISGDEEMSGIIAGVVAANEKAVSDYHEGKETAIKFLVGQVMKATRGRANPQVAAELLQKKLNEN